MHSTIQERLDKLEAHLVLLDLPKVTRVNLMDAVRWIVIEQDKVTRRFCAEVVSGLAKEPNDYRTVVSVFAIRAETAILNTRSLFP